VPAEKAAASAVPTEAPTETDAPHNPSEEPTEANEGKVRSTGAPTPAPSRKGHKKRRAPTMQPSVERDNEPADADKADDKAGGKAEDNAEDKNEDNNKDKDENAGDKPAAGKSGNGSTSETKEEEQAPTKNDDVDESLQAQLDMVKNVSLAVFACVLLFMLKRCLCSGGLSEPADPSADYSLVSVEDAADDSGSGHGVGVRMDSLRPVRHSRSHSQRGSAMQAEDEGEGDDDLDTAIALSLSEAQTQAHAMPQLQSQPQRMSTPLVDASEDDDDWDDNFDQVDSASASASTSAANWEAAPLRLEHADAEPAASARSKSRREEDNFLGAVMSGQDFNLPSSAGGMYTNRSIGSGERSGRFQKKGPATPGTTSSSGVKVIKGLSLKDAFSKNKK